MDDSAASEKIERQTVLVALQKQRSGQTLTGFTDKEISDMLDTEAALTQLDTRRPPAMSWCLIGIPTVRFGEIAETVEAIAGLPDVICETAVNDGPAGPQD